MFKSMLLLYVISPEDDRVAQIRLAFVAVRHGPVPRGLRPAAEVLRSLFSVLLCYNNNYDAFLGLGYLRFIVMGTEY